MRKVAGAVAGALVTALLAMPAAAQERTRVAHAAIMSGDLAKAERTIVADQRIYGSRPEVLLNLAAVYAQSGRVAEANALYRQVLAQDAVLMDMSRERSATSHAIAQTGLARLTPQYAQR